MNNVATLHEASSVDDFSEAGRGEAAMFQQKIKREWILLTCAVMLLSFSGEADAFGKGTKGPDVYAIQGMLMATEISPEEQRMVDLVNKERASAGLAVLTIDPQLIQTSRLKSQDMANLKYFSHESPTYGSPFDMLKRLGITYRAAGENIACNHTVESAYQALMNSPGHRANILSKDFTVIGIGIAEGGSCGEMFTQQFIGK